MKKTRHRSHPAIAKRLRFVEGHIRSIIDMIETERSCTDIAQQLHAVEKAIATAKHTLIHDHLDHCLEQTIAKLPSGERDAVEEFKTITKFL